MFKKFDDKEEDDVSQEAEPKEVYKDDGWWGKITDRINKVSECVNSGKDLEVEEEPEKKEEDKDVDEDEEVRTILADIESNQKEFASLKNRMDRTEKSLDNLGKILNVFKSNHNTIF